MFLTALDHDGHHWTVELRSIPSEEGSGLLEFSFSRTGAAGEQVRLAWRVSGNSLEALAMEGSEVSEDLLRRQLSLALAEARTVDARGIP